MVFSKKTENTSIVSNLPVKELVFTNSSASGSVNFAPLQKTAQQLKEEELEARIRTKEPELAVKGAKTGWLGAKGTTEEKPVEFKVSAWAVKAQ